MRMASVNWIEWMMVAIGLGGAILLAYGLKAAVWGEEQWHEENVKEWEGRGRG